MADRLVFIFILIYPTHLFQPAHGRFLVRNSWVSRMFPGFFSRIVRYSRCGKLLHRETPFLILPVEGVHFKPVKDWHCSEAFIDLGFYGGICQSMLLRVIVRSIQYTTVFQKWCSEQCGWRFSPDRAQAVLIDSDVHWIPRFTAFHIRSETHRNMRCICPGFARR